MSGQADYPFALWMPAHPTNYEQGRPAAEYTTIIVDHCTDGHASAQNVGLMWQGADHKSSAHFCVGQDGTVVQSVRLTDTAWHAHSANRCSIGIEHCARTPGEFGPEDPGLLPTDAMYESSARLHIWLCQMLHLVPTRKVILGHAEADPKTTHTKCPLGCGWDWDRLMGLVLAGY